MAILQYMYYCSDTYGILDPGLEGSLYPMEPRKEMCSQLFFTALTLMVSLRY